IALLAFRARSVFALAALSGERETQAGIQSRNIDCSPQRGAPYHGSHRLNHPSRRRTPMTARRFAFTLAALALAPLALTAAEKYTLKIEKPEQPGDRAKQTVTDDTDMKYTIRDGGGNVLQEKSERKEKSAV